MDKNNQVKALNQLLAKCYDSEKGYKDAAEDVDDNRLRSLFEDYARQRYDFGHEIKAEIRRLGGEPDKGSTLASKAHRAWIDLKAVVVDRDEAAILKEVKRGEQNALKNYQEALDDIAPGSTAYNTVVDQRNRIRTVLDRVEQLIPVYENENS